MKTENKIRVMIVEDDRDMRTTLQYIISSSDALTCVGAYGSCESGLPAIEEDQPDVVLMDINLPGMSGIEGVKQISLFAPEIKVIMLTVYQDDDNIFRSICAGAVGYLQKRTSKDILLSSITEVMSGGAAMNAGIALRVINLFRKTAPRSREESSLTKKESDILQSLVDGCSYKQLADRHFISIETVRNHIKHIYDKLHVHSKSEAVVKALKERLV